MYSIAGGKMFHAFLKSIARAWMFALLKFELASYDVIVQHFTHSATDTSPILFASVNPLK